MERSTPALILALCLLCMACKHDPPVAPAATIQGDDNGGDGDDDDGMAADSTFTEH